MKVSSYVRPMNTRELFGSAFRLYRKHFFGIFFINLISALMLSLLVIITSFVVYLKGGYINENNGILTTVLVGTAQIIASAPTLIAVSNAILGRPINLRNIYLRVLSLELVWKLFVISTFFTLIMLPSNILALVVPTSENPVMLCLVCFISPFIFLLALCIAPYSTFSSAVAVLEKRNIIQSVRRAFFLSSGHMLRILFNYIILWKIPFTIIIFLISFIFALIAENLLILYFAIYIVVLFIVPFDTLLCILLYYDIRARKENYSETLLAEEMGYESVGEMI